MLLYYFSMFEIFDEKNRPDRQIVAVISGDAAQRMDDDFTLFDGHGNLIELPNGTHSSSLMTSPVKMHRMEKRILPHSSSVLDQNNFINTEVLNRRLLVNLLINSYGGRAAIPQKYMEFFDYVRNHGGMVIAYVTGQAKSAAAMILNGVDEVYSLDNSEFEWHLPETDVVYNEEDAQLAQYIKKEHINEIIYGILERIQIDCQDNVRQILEHIRDENADEMLIKLNVRDLKRWGYLNGIVNQAGLEDMFLRITGIDERSLPKLNVRELFDKMNKRDFVDSSYPDGVSDAWAHSITRFWSFSEIERFHRQQLEGPSRFMPNIGFDYRGVLTEHTFDLKVPDRIAKLAQRACDRRLRKMEWSK